jgi:beta-lactamase superfamily II metal-dependent hydrolase
MKRIVLRVLLTALFVLGQGLSYGRAAEGIKMYFIDVAWGEAILMISPTGHAMMFDVGQVSTGPRVVEVLKQAGVKQIDAMVITHYHWDHFGALAQVAAAFPIGTIYDHGPNVEVGKSDEWWAQRRQLAHPGMGKETDDAWDAYVKIRDQHKHVVLKAGDKIPMDGIDVQVVCASYQTISKPLKGPGAGEQVPSCAKTEVRTEEDAEDGQSIGIVASYGKFRFINLSDLTWNVERRLFCPVNLIGTVDVYWMTHHGQYYDHSYTDYAWAVGSCPPAEIYGLHPRVSILSLGAEGHARKGATPAAVDMVMSAPGMETLWESDLITGGAEKGHNAPEKFITNIGTTGDKAQYLTLAAEPDGSFSVTNSRNSYTQNYPKR